MIRQPAREAYPNSSINALAGRFVKQSLQSHKTAGKWLKRPENRKYANHPDRQTLQRSKVTRWIKVDHFLSTVALNLIDEILFL